MAKRLFIIFFLFGAGIGGFYYYQHRASVCYSPLEYSIGRFDTEFGITKEQFIKTLKEGENVWEEGTSMDLLNYNPVAKFKVNLIFDNRQAETIEATESKVQIEESRESYDSLIAQYNGLSTTYRIRLNEYDSAVRRFEQRLAAYNVEVSRVNKKGGATPEEYDKLQIELKNLENIKQNLNDERIRLNNMASDLNTLSGQINTLAGKLDIEVDIHNERFGEAREFDQGDYTGNEINIYQFDGLADLKLVSAHEFGHALGIDHVENPLSIMYYLMDEQDLNTPILSVEDRLAFMKRCEFRLQIPKLQDLF